MSTLAVPDDLHRKVRMVASLRNLKVQEITRQIIEAGLQELAPEVMADYNAVSDLSPPDFEGLFVSEQAAISRPILRRTSRKRG